MKMSVKSSKAAKLFNTVQKAEVSWKRIKPLMKTPEECCLPEVPAGQELVMRKVSFAYDGGAPVFQNLTLTARPGDIIGITGPVACGKSTLGRLFLCEQPYGGSVRLGGRELAAQLENRQAVAAISGQVPEALHTIRTIHTLGLETYMEQRYDRRIGKSYAAVEKNNFYDAIYSPVVLMLDAVGVGGVMLLSASGSGRILDLFGMSVGTSVTIIGYISRIFSPIESLGMEIQTIQSAMAGVRRIDGFLAQSEREIYEEQATECPRGDVEFSHVTFGYGERAVLTDLSFVVHAGEHVTLVGRTGAGKSTVFRLLLGLYRPEKGRVTIGGVDVSRITDRQRRRCIGCVEQHFARVPGTVLDQITLGDEEISREMAEQAGRLAGLDAALRALPQGYDTPCTDDIFSQGEWQLLSIARAAAADPAVLLLDEITANLDAETEARVLEALDRTSKGRTVLSISHRVYKSLGGRTIWIGALKEAENAC